MGNERIEFLKEQTYQIPELCTERAEYLIEAYSECASEPIAIIRAKALEKILQKCTIKIYDKELIVGRATSKQLGGPLLPDVEWKWYMEEFYDESNRDVEKVEELSEQDKEKFTKLLSWWNGKSLCDKWWAEVPEAYKESRGFVWEQGGATPLDGQHMSHCVPGFERTITEGLRAQVDKIDRRMAQLNLSNIDELQQHTFLRAMKIAVNATITFAHRYSDLALEMANNEMNRERKEELLKIAEVCRHSPEYPARSIHEALQAMWITYLAVMVEGYGPGIGFGRVDQYLYPIYKKELEEGRSTREQIKELIALFYIKINEPLMPTPIGSSGKSGGQGSITLSTVTLGGTSRGSHTTNFAEDLTMLFLEAEEDVMLREDMAFRIYGNISDALLMKACNLAKLVKGKIKFVSDETVIAQQLNEGRPIDVARDYALTGCFLHTVPGITHDPGGDFFCLPMMLELALNNGVCRYNNKRFGPETGDPRKFNTYEDVWNAYTEQIRALLPVSISGQNLTFKLSGEMLPSPLMSALYDGCIESGRDVVNCGGKYNSVSLWVSGIPSVADSLAALKKTVFEDHVLTMDEVITAIENDFVGYENVQKILSSAPKYGNDIDYVDYIVNDVISFMADEIKQYKAPYGRQWTCAGAAITSNVSLGRVVAAMPDGRKAGEPYSEGGMSPFQGRNVSGVTSTLVSAAKVNLTKATGGSVVNLKINPDGMNDKMKMWKFANLLRTACQMGLDIVQFNFISNEVLREAQAHPENYRDLLVRVATYSAYFVGLPLDVQNEIISRTEFEGI